MKALPTSRQGLIVTAIWIAATAVLAWQLFLGRHTFDSPATLLGLFLLLVCTLALLRLLPNPIPAQFAGQASRRGWFILSIAVTTITLLLLEALIGRLLLLIFPLIAILVLIILKGPVTEREITYALVLALAAGIAGLGAGWINFITPLQWSLLQFALVFPGLLAGWRILQYTGLSQSGVGLSRFLAHGGSSAVLGFLQGILISIPWALGNLVLGGSSSETWVATWWQPFTAIQPGIAEEAWGRILLVPLIYLLFRLTAQPRKAFTAALLVAGYWFAYLHTAGGLGAIVSTIMIGTLFALPTSYLCLYHDLETAIGFHFWIDFIKFAFALFLSLT